MKRGKITLVAGEPIIRVSRPGFDVDTATISQLLLHEDHLFSQALQFGYVVNTGAGTTVSVPIQDDMGLNVDVYIASYFGSASKYVPATYFYQSGGSYQEQAVGLQLSEDSMLITWFSSILPTGVFYILTRRV